MALDAVLPWHGAAFLEATDSDLADESLFLFRRL
jgi:hypothetical protein